jgi:hypothetical protein
MKTQGRLPSPKGLVMLLMAAAVLLPSLYGFGTKLIEFIALFRGDVDGAFAISPVLNYLLASLGFLCLFGWAAMHGMFRDVEGPKIAMLENEARLDADSRSLRNGPFSALPANVLTSRTPSRRHRFGDFK